MRKTVIYNNEELNYEVSDEGKVYNKKTGRELKGTYATNEYHSIQLIIDNKKLKTFMVHRLVAEAFCDNPNGYNIVDHINRDKHDDRASNLRWVTSKENSKNCIRNINSNHKYYLDDFSNDWKEVHLHPNYMINRNTAEIVNKSTRIVLKGVDRHGYKRVKLDDSLESIHILMWRTYNGYVHEGYEIDHIDGDRSNNSLSNLREVSHSENVLNAYKHGHKNAVKIYQFDLEGNCIKEFNSIRDAANSIGALEAAVKDASNRKGTCSGYYWLREEDKNNIIEILTGWVPDGFKIIPSHPTYCINKDGDVYNKRNKKLCSYYYLKDGKTKMIQIGTRRYHIDDFIKETYAID